MPSSRLPALLGCLLLGLASIAVPSRAQDTIPHRFEPYVLDTGAVSNATPARAVVFEQTIAVEGATWLRLFFAQADLGQIRGREDVAVIRMTSLEDGAVQVLTPETLRQWQRSSAFFNGDAVRLEILADPDAPASRVSIREIMVGERATASTNGRSICGPDDDRLLSNDPRAGRIMPVGCTGWLIDDAEGCFLTAGHCAGAALSVVEFDVPLSDPDGSTNHAPPDQQYPIDPASVQFLNGGVGNDWGYFGAFPNSTTFLTAIDAQGDNYVLGTPPVVPGGEMIEITGYGSVSGTQGTPQTWSQVQTTHIGPIASVTGTTLRYSTDTTGGNSGSAVFDDTNGVAIGIHTHAGCGAGGGSNQGTSILHAGLQSALANPQGVCADGQVPLLVTTVTPAPSPLPPGGGIFGISVTDRTGATATINGATLVSDDGSGDQTSALGMVAPGTYQGVLLPTACGNTVRYRIDVEATDGTIVHHPFTADNGLDRRFRRTVADAFDHAFADDFETDMGWTVTDDVGLSAGSWERGIPAGYGLRQDPPWDADGSGSAFLTENAGGNTDVDGGTSVLTSPSMDASASFSPHITYWRWWDDGGTSDDSFTVELSNDDGATWTTLETIGPNVTGQGWVFQSWRIQDVMTPTDQMRIRFTVADVGAGNVVEAAIDGVALWNTSTGIVCGTNLFTDGFESGDTSAWSATVQ